MKKAILSYFKQFGPVAKVQMKFDSIKGRIKNFCYVKFEDSSSLSRVLEVQNHSINHRPLTCQMCKPLKEVSSRQGSDNSDETLARQGLARNTADVQEIKKSARKEFPSLENEVRKPTLATLRSQSEDTPKVGKHRLPRLNVSFRQYWESRQEISKTFEIISKRHREQEQGLLCFNIPVYPQFTQVQLPPALHN